jgi:hypothetical protein
LVNARASELPSQQEDSDSCVSHGGHATVTISSEAFTTIAKETARTVFAGLV